MQYKKIPIYYTNQHYNAYQNELFNLLHFLNEVHPAFSLDSGLYEKMHKEATHLCTLLVGREQEELATFQLLLNGYLTQLCDAHSYVYVSTTRLYPLTVRYWQGAFYLYSTPSHHKAQLGKTILQINGKKLAEIGKQLQTWIPAENEIKAGITGSYFLNNPAFLQLIGVEGAFHSLHLTFADGSSENFSLAEQSEAHLSTQMHNHPITQRKELPFSYQIVNSICYFQFNAMFDQFTYEMGCEIAGEPLNEAIYHSLPRFESFLTTMYADMEDKGVQLLAVDMRYNGGGNSLLGDMLLDTLLPEGQPIKRYETWIKTSEFANQQLPFLSAEECKAHSLVPFDFATYAARLKNYKRLKQHYSGKVIFIQGQNSFSSANYLLTTVKDNELFPIIGSCTSQQPTCFGDIMLVTLPFTGTKGYISHSLFKRPCTELDGETTLYPDVVVNNALADLAKGRDNCWEWVLTFSDGSSIVI